MSASGDIITDFNPIEDIILISKSGFNLSQEIGTLDPTNFQLGTKAREADDRFIYNQRNGQ
jgi:hypothetical protein